MEPLKEEPLKEDPLIKGQCIIYLSTMDKTKSPNFILPYQYKLEPLKEDNLYTGENPLEFISVPKCLLLGGFTVLCIIVFIKYDNVNIERK